MSNTRHLASLSNSPSRPLGTAIACVQCCIDLLNPSVVCHNLCIWTQIFDSLGAASSLSSGFSSLHREPKSIKRLKTREMNCRRIRELPTSLQRLCHLILKDKDVTVKAAQRGYSTPPPRRWGSSWSRHREGGCCSEWPAWPWTEGCSCWIPSQILQSHENRLWKLKTLLAVQILILVFTDKWLNLTKTKRY